MADEITNPYVGLRPFDTDDSDLFFGRTRQTTELLQSLHDHRFLAVVGSSGCGKSSLIRAGLIPALLGGFLHEDRDVWAIAQALPGDRPLLNLANALTKAFATAGISDAPDLTAVLEGKGVAALRESLLASVHGETNLFIFVDQFEEIFAFRGRRAGDGEENQDPEQRKDQVRRQEESDDFVALLLALSRTPGKQIYVTMTMRSDFEGDCDVFYGLPEAMNRGRYLVPRLTPDQLEMAIKGPARSFGADISKALLDRLRNELGDRFDRLPVLQHALRRTWETWIKLGKQGPILVDHYKLAGTIEGALAQHAGELMAALAADPELATMSPEERERQVMKVFQSLTDTDSLNRQVRRPARRKTIADETGLEPDRVKRLLRPFVDAGFLYTTGDAANPRYSLSHESLIRQWDQLKAWVGQERLSRDSFRELVQRANEEKPRGLLSGPDLAFKEGWWKGQQPAPAWAERYVVHGDGFTVAKNFLDRSASRERIRRRTLTVAVVGALAIMTLLTAWALIQGRAAERNLGLAQGNEQRAIDNEKIAIDAYAQASENLERAELNEIKANAAAAEAKANLEAAQAAERRANTERRSAEQSLANLRKAQEGEKVATTRATESSQQATVANIASRLDSREEGPEFWQLSEGTDELRELLIRRVLESEADAGRFVRAEGRVIGTVLGLTPAARVPLVQRAVGLICIDGGAVFRGAYYRSEACTALIDELRRAPNAEAAGGLRQRAFTRINGLLNAEQYEELRRAIELAGPLLSPVDAQRVGKALLSSDATRSVGAKLELVVAGVLQADELERRLVADIAEHAEQLASSDYQAGKVSAVASKLSEDTFQKFKEGLLSRSVNGRMDVMQAAQLAWLVRYLTIGELAALRSAFLEMLTANDNGSTARYERDVARDALTQIGQSLGGSPLAQHQEVLLGWVNGQSLDVDPLLMDDWSATLRPGRASVAPGRVAILAPAMLAALQRPERQDGRESERVLAKMSLLHATGAWELLPGWVAEKLGPRQAFPGGAISFARMPDADFLSAMQRQMVTMMRLEPPDEDAKSRLARSYASLGRWLDDAQWESALRAIPPTSQGWLTLATIAERNDLTRSRQAFRRWGELVRGQVLDAGVYRSLADLADRMGVYEPQAWAALVDALILRLERSSKYDFTAGEVLHTRASPGNRRAGSTRCDDDGQVSARVVQSPVALAGRFGQRARPRQLLTFSGGASKTIRSAIVGLMPLA